MKRRSVFILLFGWFIFASLGLFSQQDDNAFGINTHAFPAYGDCTQNEKDLFLDMGVKWMRGGFEWQDIETQLPNRYRWTEQDKIVKFANNNEINLLINLGGGGIVNFVADNGTNYFDVDAWVNFVTAIVNRYDGTEDPGDIDLDGFNDNKRIKIYWEIWNEPNLSKFWNLSKSQYIENCLKPAIRAIRAADPNAKICGPALSAWDCEDRDEWTEFIHRELGGNGIDTFDVITTHQYQVDEVQDRVKRLERYYDLVKSLSTKGSALEFWVTETGWKHQKFTECEVAKNLYDIMSAMEHIPWWKKTFWYCWRQDPREEEEFGITNESHDPRIAYYAYRSVIKDKPFPPHIFGFYYFHHRPQRMTMLLWVRDCVGYFYQNEWANVFNIQICDASTKNLIYSIENQNVEYLDNDAQIGYGHILPEGLFTDGNRYICRVQAKNISGVWEEWGEKTITFHGDPINPYKPGKGETIFKDDPTSIEWINSELIQSNLRITLLKGGIEIGTIAENVDYTLNSFSWNVNTFGAGYGNGYQIRISTMDGVCQGDSEGTFSIEEPESDGIIIKIPAAGDRWRKWMYHNIKYRLACDPASTLGIYLHGPTSGILKNNIDSDYKDQTDKVDPDWSWLIDKLADGTPIQPGFGYRVELYSKKDRSMKGVSEPFTIVDGIRITAPTQGQVIYRNQNFNVTFDPPANCRYLNMRLFRNNQQYKSGVIYNPVGNDGNKNWLVDKLLDKQVIEPGGGYQIKLTSNQDGEVNGYSPVFSIVEYIPPQISITSPRSGDTVTRGATISVTWSSVNVSGEVRLDYSVNGGSSWNTVTASTPNDGSHSLTVPDAPFLLRISSVALPAVEDTEGPVNVGDPPPPSITVTSPNGGEVWQTGLARSITWNAASITGSLTLSLYKDSQLLGNIAASVNPSLGAYSWTVGQYAGGTAAAGAGYTVKIEATGGQAADMSDNTFAISNLPTEQLIAYYPFNGNAQDESVNDNHGTVSGATLTADRFARANSAYRFTLNSNRIDCGNHASLRITDSQLSVSLWLKVDEVIYSSVIGKSSTSEWKNGWGIFCTETALGFFLNDWTIRVVTPFVDTASWHHIVAVYNGADIRLYLDGAFKAMRNCTGNIVDGGNLLINSIGGYTGGKKRIDDVRIYHRALSSQEVQALYNE